MYDVLCRPQRGKGCAVSKKVDFKHSFGEMFRAARDKRGLSRAALSVRIGVSAKTIQSWEVGRTFIEDLSIIPILDSELETSIIAMIAKASGAKHPAPDDAPPSHRASSTRQRGDIVPLHLYGATPEQAHEIEAAFVAVPVLFPNAACVDVPGLKQEHIERYITIPRSWVPRGGTLVAFKMLEGVMEPTIPQGAHVVVNRRHEPPGKVVGKMVALEIRGQFRIRRLTKKQDGTFLAEPEGVGRPGALPFSLEAGDRVLGRIRGVLAQPF